MSLDEARALLAADDPGPRRPTMSELNFLDTVRRDVKAQRLPGSWVSAAEELIADLKLGKPLAALSLLADVQQNWADKIERRVEWARRMLERDKPTEPPFEE